MNPFTLFMKAAMDAMIRPDSTKPSFHKLLYKIRICKSEYCRSLQELSFTIPVTGNASRNPSVINAGIQICPLDIVFRCLEENILDFIASHLRFTDKYFFQSQWKHFTEKWILFLNFFHDLCPCASCCDHYK